MEQSTSDENFLRTNLEKHNQLQLLDFWDELDLESRQVLKDQIEEIDFEQLSELVTSAEKDQSWAELAKQAEPPNAWKIGEPFGEFSNAQAIEAGEAALAQGEIGMILVAGGQGTRLGFDQPKGLYPIGPQSNRTLMQIFFDLVQARSKRYGQQIPLYIMTSSATHGPTLEYLDRMKWLGLEREQVTVFCQGRMPAVERESGKVLLAGKAEIAMSPNGHGGMLDAFQASACLDNTVGAGVKHLFYGQVDNPMMQLCDPLLIGSHLLAKSEMTTQVVRKQFPKQRVGNVVSIDGKLAIIEYSDLPDDVAELTDDQGNLKLWAGNIAVHVFATEFLQRMSSGNKGLPFHRAIKKVAFVDSKGDRIEPSEPNAMKFEKFIFDLLPEANNGLVVEVDPADGFAPVKNAADAESETAATAKAAMLAQHRKWLVAAGYSIPDDLEIEISPLFALDAEELKTRIPAGTTFDHSRFLQ